jgi:type IV pilus assembly protein PilV
MIEVLASILIVSIGLIGLAGLQIIGLRNAQGATQRTIAAQLAYDITDRMRANMLAVGTGDYNYPTYSAGAGGTAGTNTASCFASAGCTTTQMAQQDVFEWNNQILAQLPQPAGTTVGGVVCIDSTPNDAIATPSAPACDNIGSLYVVKIWWLEDRNNPSLPLKYFFVTFES